MAEDSKDRPGRSVVILAVVAVAFFLVAFLFLGGIDYVTDLPLSPNPVRNTALALAVGLVFVLGMAFLYRYLNDTIALPEKLEGPYGAPALGVIPYDALGKDGVQELVVGPDMKASRGAEAYRMVRNVLDFINFEHDIKSLLVTSATPQEGKTTVATNLAASLAQAGWKVAFVCCDFRRPTAHRFFGVPNLIGLSDVLLGMNSLEAALQKPLDDNLFVLTSGKMPPNPAELLGSERMKEIVDSLAKWADWIIIDSPSLLAVADAAATARLVDGVLMVTRAGVSTRTAAQGAAEQLASVGAWVVGVVMTASTEGKAGREGYYGCYQYYDYYATADEGRGRRSEKGGRGYEPSKDEPPMPDSAERPPPRTYVHKESAVRKIAVFVGRTMTVLLAFLVVLMIAALATYFLDQYFEWGIVETLGGML